MPAACVASEGLDLPNPNAPIGSLPVESKQTLPTVATRKVWPNTCKAPVFAWHVYCSRIRKDAFGDGAWTSVQVPAYLCGHQKPSQLALLHLASSKMGQGVGHQVLCRWDVNPGLGKYLFEGSLFGVA